MAERLRILLLCAHPVQYASPLFRLMAKRPSLDVTVAYCSLHGAERALDPDFGVEVAWDVPLLDGYPWVQLKNYPLSRVELSFTGLINPGVWQLIRREKFDAVAIFTGYRAATFWIAVLAAKLSGVPILFGTDATSVAPQDGKRWKAAVKKRLLPRVFRLADIATAPSAATRQYFITLGIPESRIVLTPFVVDNDWWGRHASEINRDDVRRHWGVPAEATVALFCAKLQPWKRPLDALRAFARANVPGSYLVFAGDGLLRKELEAEAKSAGVAERVRFLGFVNQTGLPSVYCASDVLVLPSEYDACPVVVCEAMLCGCPVLLSDQIRGRFDLVESGQTGFIFPCGDVNALAALLTKTLGSPELLRKLGEAARKRMETWGPGAYVEAFINAVERAKHLRARRAAN